MKNHKIEIHLLDESNKIPEFVLKYPLSFNLKRDILSQCSSFDFSISKSNLGLIPKVLPYENKRERFDVIKALNVGRMVKFYVDEKIQFFGYIVSNNSSSANNSDVFQFKCLDLIWRLENTTLFQNRTIAGSNKIETIIEFALKGTQQITETGKINGWMENDPFKTASIVYSQKEHLLKLTGKSPSNDLESDLTGLKVDDLKPGKGGGENETIYGFIKRIIKPFGFICQASNDGNLLIFRPNVGDEPRFSFVNNFEPNYKNKMIGNPKLNINIENLHSSYFVYGNSISSEKGRSLIYFKYENPDALKNSKNELIVQNILFHKDGKQLKSRNDCEKLAKRLCGFENAKYYNYSFTMPGFGIDGLLFSNDCVVNVNDELNGVNGNLYVKSVELSGNPTEFITNFDCCLCSALLLE